jgi:uncharacterized protein (TIGR02996 family)
VTTEDEFQALLDANPDDHTTRLVMADWLEERGDPRADGYRALGLLQRRPKSGSYSRGVSWFFWNRTYVNGPFEIFLDRQSHNADEGNELPNDWYKKMRKLKQYETAKATNLWAGYTLKRRDLEDLVALAFAKLPTKRRAELLAGKGAEELVAKRKKKSKAQPRAKGKKKAKPKGRKK